MKIEKKLKNTMRLAKFLAEAGIASRRKSEELIRTAQVKIAGQIVDNVATNVSLDQDDITVNGQKISLDKKVYFLLNKPKGYISSVSDPHNTKTAVSLLPKNPRVFPVGRLDMDSSGLLLLTNDGELTYRLTHPKFEIKKTYVATVNKKLDKNIVAILKQGIKLPEGLAKADKARILNDYQLEIVIHQGWNRQIRRMLGAEGLRVTELKRIAEGKLKLDDLASGEYKVLKLEDIL
ncbi:MAG: pseudouridine synthase [Patescibacteria group bacterium]